MSDPLTGFGIFSGDALDCLDSLNLLRRMTPDYRTRPRAGMPSR
jgi:hypothetical protein